VDAKLPLVSARLMTHNTCAKSMKDTTCATIPSYVLRRRVGAGRAGGQCSVHSPLRVGS
jgi:hypothetical protein